MKISEISYFNIWAPNLKRVQAYEENRVVYINIHNAYDERFFYVTCGKSI